MTGSRKPLKFWSLTIAKIDNLSVDRMKSILTEFTDQWIFQKEAGTQTGHIHYQCRFIIDPAQYTETLLTIFEARGIVRETVTFLPESNNSISQGGLTFYVMKDDTRVDGPWYDPSFKPRKRVTYEGRDLECMKDPRGFQRHIIDDIKPDADDRTMNWWFNKSGCGGKSKLMKWLRWTTDDVARVGLGSATQIKTSIIEKGPHRAYMVDLPRVRGSDERQQELFSALEEIKNGWVESPMYGKSAELLMEPPHIHIFSNELPNLTYASMDRWKIWIIEDLPSFGQHYRRLTVEEVIELQNPNKE